MLNWIYKIPRKKKEETDDVELEDMESLAEKGGFDGTKTTGMPEEGSEEVGDPVESEPQGREIDPLERDKIESETPTDVEEESEIIETTTGSNPIIDPEVHPSISTVSRIQAIFSGDTEFEGSFKIIYKSFNGTITQIEGEIFGEEELDKEKAKKYFSLRSSLMGVLPITDQMNLHKKEDVDAAVNQALMIMLGVAEEGKIQEELEKAGIKEEQLSDIKNFIKMRLLLNITGPIESGSFDIGREITAFKKRDTQLQKFVGTDHFPNTLADSIVKGEELSKEQLEKIVQPENKIPDRDVYKVATTDGRPIVVITNIDVDNIKTAIKQLEHRSSITCHNLPKEFHLLAEREAIKAWKPVYFDKIQGDYSRYMPNRPGSWLEFYQKIEKNEPQQRVGQIWMTSPPSTEKFVEEIIGDDPEILKSFWDQVVDSGEEEVINKVAGQLSKEQVEKLVSSYNGELKKIARKPTGGTSETEVGSYVYSEIDVYRSGIVKENCRTLLNSQPETKFNATEMDELRKVISEQDTGLGSDKEPGEVESALV